MKYYDFHIELEMPSGYKDEYSGVSLSEVTALQVNSMIYHRAQNEVEDFQIKVRVFGNHYEQPKAQVIKEAVLDVRSGADTKADYHHLLKSMFRDLSNSYA